MAPEIEPYLAAAFSGTTVAAVAAGTAAVSGAATAAAWAVAGVAANTAGQLASDAVGASNGYSFKEALVAGAETFVTGEITQGVEGGKPGILGSKAGLSPEGATVVGAADYAAGVAADKLVGLPTQFSWAGLVAAGVSAGVTNAAGLSTTQSSALGAGGTFGQSFAGGLVQGALNREISQGLGDDRVQSWAQIAEDAFGNALGNAAVGAINASNAQSAAQQQAQLEATTQSMQSNFSNELQGDIDAQMGQTGAQAMASIRAQGQATLNQEYAGTEQALEAETTAAAEAQTQADGAALGQAALSRDDAVRAVQAGRTYNAVNAWMSADVQQAGFDLFPGAIYGPAPDITDHISPLQMQLMDTDPHSALYAQLEAQVEANDPIDKLLGPPMSLTPADPSLYHIPEGPLEKLEGVALQGVADPNNNMLERLAYGSLALTSWAPSMAEYGLRTLAGTPNDAYVGGWYAAAAVAAPDSTDFWNDVDKSAGALSQALMNVAAVTGVGAAYDGIDGSISIGNGLLGSSWMPTAIGTGSGALAGYETGGWQGAIVGGVVGGAVGWFAPEGSPELNDSFGAMLGTTAEHVVFNAAGGGAATIAANILTEQPSWHQDWGYGIAVGALAPIASGESFFIGAGGVAEFGPGATNVFAAGTGAWNIFGAALIAAKSKNEGRQ